MSILTRYGVTLTVELGLSAATGNTYGIWDSGLWDNATWGPDDVWEDVTQWVRAVDTDSAFGRDVRSWEAGTARIVLDDRDGRFNPDNPNSPYRINGISSIRPWRPVRARAAYGGVEYPIWRGYVKPWDERYSAVRGPNTGDVELTLACVDEFGSLARYNPLAQNSIGQGETSGVRIHRILNNAGHMGPRDIHPGNVTMQATTLANNVVTDLKLTADSEGGAVYVGPDGTIIFQHNYALIENTRSNTRQVLWGDDPAAGELPYTDVEPNYDGDMIINVAQYARVNGTAQVVTNEASRALYGPAGLPRTDLMCETDAQVKTLAQFDILQYADPTQRISHIGVTPLSPDPARSAQMWPVVLGARVRDLHRVLRRPAGGYTITKDVHVSGIHHRIRLDDWRTTFDFFSAEIYQGIGRWDYGVWDTSEWFI